MKRIIIHSEAELELWQGVDYYETRGVGLGLDLEQEGSRALVDIQEAPNRWPTRKYRTRCRLLHRFPYAIYYLELQDIIWVVAVAHTSRRPYYGKKIRNELATEHTEVTEKIFFGFLCELCGYKSPTE